MPRILTTAMHYFPSHSIELPDWQAASVSRLRISMLVATAIVATLLSVMRLPEVRIMDPLLELNVEVTRPEVTPVEVPPEKSELETPTVSNEVANENANLPVASESRTNDQGEKSSSESSAPTATVEQSFDWEAAKTVAVLSAVDAIEEPDRVNPDFDQQRAAAAIKFRASAAPVKKEIWENVEKDQLGRTLLRKGDCYRVLDDPSAVNRWAFENFGQYITYCTNRKYVGKDLEWVADIHQRFAYLRDRIDGRNGLPADD